MNNPFEKKTYLEILIIIFVGISTGYLKSFLFKQSMPLFGHYNLNSLKTQSFNTTSPLAVDAESVMHLYENGFALIIDIRPSIEYKNGHIPASINVRKDTYNINFINFRTMNKIIIIISDSSSNDSIADFCFMLNKKGINNILVYKKGIKDWIKNGYLIEKSKTLK